MEGTKALFSSKTFWGVLIAFAAMIANATGKVSIDKAMEGSMLSLVAEVGGLAGTAWALYGRVVASKKIG